MSTMNLKEEFYNLIKNEKKTSEGRFGKRDYNPGDEITFKCGENQLKVVVSEVCFYPSFETMLESNLAELLPGYDMEQGIAVYNKIYGENMKKAKENNDTIVMTVIKFKLI